MFPKKINDKCRFVYVKPLFKPNQLTTGSDIYFVQSQIHKNINQ